MSLENGKKSIENRRSAPLEAGAFAMAILGAIDATPAKSLEIAPSTSWQVGIQNNIRNSVLKEKVEGGAVYFLYKDGSGAWASVANGEKSSITRSTAPEITYIVQNARDKKIEIRCDIHTHPMVNTFKGPRGAEYAISVAPPSFTDINYAEAEAAIKNSYRTYKFDYEKSVQGVADSKGIWYYSSAKNELISPESRRVFSQAAGTFSGRAILDPAFDFPSEYQKLRNAYRAIGSDVRFVPYEQLDQEPPCAGVDYQVGPAVEKVAAPAQPRDVSAPQRRSLKEATDTPSRRALPGSDGPTIYRVGPPQR